jgi:hypothetical protein
VLAFDRRRRPKSDLARQPAESRVSGTQLRGGQLRRRP